MLYVFSSISFVNISVQQIARNLLPAPQLEDMSAAKMILPQTETQRVFSEIVSSGMTPSFVHFTGMHYSYSSVFHVFCYCSIVTSSREHGRLFC